MSQSSSLLSEMLSNESAEAQEPSSSLLSTTGSGSPSNSSALYMMHLGNSRSPSPPDGNSPPSTLRHSSGSRFRTASQVQWLVNHSADPTASLLSSSYQSPKRQKTLHFDPTASPPSSGFNEESMLSRSLPERDQLASARSDFGFLPAWRQAPLPRTRRTKSRIFRRTDPAETEAFPWSEFAPKESTPSPSSLRSSSLHSLVSSPVRSESSPPNDQGPSHDFPESLIDNLFLDLYSNDPAPSANSEEAPAFGEMEDSFFHNVLMAATSKQEMAPKEDKSSSNLVQLLLEKKQDNHQQQQAKSSSSSRLSSSSRGSMEEEIEHFDMPFTLAEDFLPFQRSNNTRHEPFPISFNRSSSPARLSRSSNDVKDSPFALSSYFNPSYSGRQQPPPFRSNPFLTNLPEPHLSLSDAFSPTEPSRYVCPLCSVADFTEDALVSHVLEAHSRRSDKKQAICPVCSTKPGGDPNYVSKDFYAHVKYRHVGRGSRRDRSESSHRTSDANKEPSRSSPSSMPSLALRLSSSSSSVMLSVPPPVAVPSNPPPARPLDIITRSPNSLPVRSSLLGRSMRRSGNLSSADEWWDLVSALDSIAPSQLDSRQYSSPLRHSRRHQHEQEAPTRSPTQHACYECANGFKASDTCEIFSCQHIFHEKCVLALHHQYQSSLCPHCTLRNPMRE